MTFDVGCLLCLHACTSNQSFHICKLHLNYLYIQAQTVCELFSCVSWNQFCVERHFHIYRTYTLLESVERELYYFLCAWTSRHFLENHIFQVRKTCMFSLFLDAFFLSDISNHPSLNSFYCICCNCMDFQRQFHWVHHHHPNEHFLYMQSLQGMSWNSYTVCVSAEDKHYHIEERLYI